MCSPAVYRIMFMLLVVAAATFLGNSLISTAASPAEAPPADDAAAGDSPPLRVVGRVPLEGKPFDGQLVVFFNQPLATLPQETETPAVVFEPPLPGRIAIEDNHVAFTPLQDAASEHAVYQATLNPALRAKNGAGFEGEAPSFPLATASFVVQRVGVLEETGTAMRVAALFSLPYDLDALRDHLTVVDAAGAGVCVEVARGSSARSAVISVPLSAAQPWKITLPAGIPDASGTLETPEDTVHRLPGSDTPLEVRDVSWASRKAGGAIEIALSSAVQPEAFTRRLTITNTRTSKPVDFELINGEEAADTFVAAFDEKLTPGTRVRVTIEEGLYATDMTSLPDTYRSAIAYKSSDGGDKSVRMRYAHWHSKGVEGPAVYLSVSADPGAQALEEHLHASPPVENLRVKPAGYGSRYYVYGDWKTGEAYELVLEAGIADRTGEHERETPQSYALGKPPKVASARIDYAGKFYFPRRGGTELAVESRNKDNVELSVHRLFPSNIAVALDSLNRGRGSHTFDKRWSERLTEKEIPVANTPDTIVTTPLDLNTLFEAPWRGVFRITLEQHSGGQLVVWTDLGVMAHWEQEGVVVFVHDLATLEPVAGAAVTVHSTKNQKLGHVTTDEAGIARLTGLNAALGTPKVIVAEKEDDFTFLELEHREDDPVAFTSAMPRYDATAYDAFIYADRELYRPGSTAHLHWIVRDTAGGPAQDVPLQLRVVRPSKSEMLKQTVTLSQLGTGGLDLDLPESAQTGAYRVSLHVPGETDMLGMYKFAVEDFVPNRIEASIETADTLWLPGQTQEITLEAAHLFGAPARARDAAFSLVLRKGGFAPENWQGFTFENDTAFDDDRVNLGKGETGPDGTLTQTFTVPKREQVTFPMTGTVVAKVSETGGRAVTATQEVTILPAPTMLGVTVAEGPGASGINVQAAAVNAAGEAAALDQAEIVLEREEWRYTVRRYRGHLRPDWTREFKETLRAPVELHEGRGKVTLDIPRGYGLYRVRVVSEETPAYASVRFRRYWDGRLRSVTTATPSLLTIATDKETYQPGDPVTVRFEAPFDGKAFVAVQGGDLVRAEVVDIEDGRGALEFVAGYAHVPNIYVHATVVHRLKSDSDNVYPRSTFAMHNVPVRDPRKQIDVQFTDLPETVRPAQEVGINVETRDHKGAPVPSEVTVALVDEGIHGITDYESPSPYAWLMRLRRPDYQRAHYYDKVAYDFGQKPIGGGLAGRLGEGAPFVSETWIKPLALWSGAVQTGGDGRAKVKFTLPEFNGKVRLDAVAVNDKAMGANSANVRVRRPYMLRTSVPRFVHAGDEFTCRATVFNTKAQAVQARIAWQGTERIAAGKGARTIGVPGADEGALTADFTAGDVPGQGYVDWRVKILNEDGKVIDTIEERAPLPVRPPVVYRTDRTMTTLAPGEERSFENTAFVEAANLEREIYVGASPFLRLQHSLDHLVRYPYGCLEQTISALMPLYLLRANEDLLRTVDDLDSAALQAHIQAGIDRLSSMQTGSGGLSAWPGSVDPYPYGSVYACHFLTLIKQDGDMEVPGEMFGALQDYVRDVANDWEGDMPGFRNGHEPSKHYLRAYAHFVLALDGDLEAIRQISRFDAITVPKAARYLLAAALAANTEDSDRIALYLNERPSVSYAVTEQTATLNSEIRNAAVQLLALCRADLRPKEQAKLASRLVNYIDVNRYGNTQETAFIVTALAAYFEHIEETGAAAYTLDTPAGKQQADGTKTLSAQLRGASAPFHVKNTGDTTVYVNRITRGTPRKPQTEAESEGYAVGYQLRDFAGRPVAANDLVQGERYVVTLEIEAAYECENVVVDSPLAAGLEIENPRLTSDTLADLDATDDALPTHLEVRDTRYIAAFNRLDNGKHTLHYAVRAVTPGTFARPGVRVECMYVPSIYGTSEGGAVTIRAEDGA
ncbi:MAG: alpha-2-macroglobulin family protein [Candidatus Hydrogenedentota bacterium]